MDFFQMLYAEDEEYEPYGVAYGPEDADLFVLPSSGTKVSDWQPLELSLREGGFADYLANDLGVRLCSGRLHASIEDVRPKSDSVQWLDVTVADSHEIRQYHVLHFPVNYPVVNESRSIMAGPMVVKPVFCASAIADRHIFTLPNAPGGRLFVSRRLKNAILAANCTGLSFAKVGVCG